jgi:hypothetical protein
MGVYATVHICIDRAQPLSAESRAAVVELAISHELITRDCAVSVPKPMPIRSVIDAIKALFGARHTYNECIEKGEPGSWVAERVRAAAPEFSVSSTFPTWKGASLSGPFVYTCYARRKAIKVVNALRSPEERSPHEPPDGVVGRFFDVIEIDAKRDYDARIAASSAFVKELKKLAGAKVICRTSWG